MRGEASTIRPACDGDHCIAECACPGPDLVGDWADSNLALSLSNGAAYYYHYDALGSVVALSDSAGDTVQVYEYDVYGQVAASDPNHPNPFLFTGRRYDTETGLYYYRARYYNSTLGRFLQTDRVGYADGINWYAYCANNPVTRMDPSGKYAIQWPKFPGSEDWYASWWPCEERLQQRFEELNETIESGVNTVVGASLTVAKPAGMIIGGAAACCGLRSGRWRDVCRWRVLLDCSGGPSDGTCSGGRRALGHTR